MSQVTGVVTDIPQITTKCGKTMYSIVVNGDRFGIGMYPPKCSVGDTVTFTMSMNGQYKNAEPKTIVVSAGVPRQDVAQVGKTAEAAGPVRGYGKSDEVQDTISKQSALNTAIAFVKLAQEAGALPAPAKAKDKLEALDAIVKQYAREFYGFSTGKELPVGDAPAKDPAVSGLEADGEWAN